VQPAHECAPERAGLRRVVAVLAIVGEPGHLLEGDWLVGVRGDLPDSLLSGVQGDGIASRITNTEQPSELFGAF
jgi:hypothetical protein